VRYGFLYVTDAMAALDAMDRPKPEADAGNVIRLRIDKSTAGPLR
jgi:hypothetical protein